MAAVVGGYAHQIRFQAQPKPIYRNSFHALAEIFRAEGVAGLYKVRGSHVADRGLTPAVWQRELTRLPVPPAREWALP